MTSLTEVPGEPTGGAVTGSAGSLSDQLDGAHVAVVGLGRTGRAVAEALATLGARLHLFDSQEASIEALDASAHGILATSVVSATVAGSEATAAALADSPAGRADRTPRAPQHSGAKTPSGAGRGRRLIACPNHSSSERAAPAPSSR